MNAVITGCSVTGEPSAFAMAASPCAPVVQDCSLAPAAGMAAAPSRSA